MTSLRLAVWSETIALTGAYVVAIWWAAQWTTRYTESRALALALGFALVQVVAIVFILSGLFLRKSLTARRVQQTAALQREINEALASHSLGHDQLRPLRGLMKRSRRDVEREIGAMLATTRGNPRDRVVAVAGELGILADEAQRVETIFGSAISGSLLSRAVAVEQLKGKAGMLQPALARALNSNDLRRVRGALDILRAWKRSLPLPSIEPLLSHPDPRVRADAIRALPYAWTGDPTSAIETALHDGSPDVRVAATQTAAVLGVEAVAPAILANVRDADRDVALASAFAIAGMNGGSALLQEIIEADNRAAAAVAFEALEKSALGRLG